MRSVICLMGPTAVGKSQLALSFAEALPCNIISVDSVMIYKDMDIGTAKPKTHILEKFPHYLINLRSPTDTYSAGDFFRDVRDEIQKSQEQKKIPLLVGGTMLYFHVLQQGLSELPTRQSSLQFEQQQLQTLSLGDQYKQLIQVDPNAAKRTHPHDTQRIQRALLVHHLSRQALSSLQQASCQLLPFSFINIAIFPKTRHWLREIIAKRFQKMLNEGLISEIEKLYQKGYLLPHYPASRAVGYRQVLAYLSDQINYDLMKTQAITATCQLAKRQLTWLRHWPNLHSFQSDDPALLSKIIALVRKEV